jgi:hypothetical protein
MYWGTPIFGNVTALEGLLILINDQSRRLSPPEAGPSTGVISCHPQMQSIVSGSFYRRRPSQSALHFSAKVASHFTGVINHQRIIGL